MLDAGGGDQRYLRGRHAGQFEAQFADYLTRYNRCGERPVEDRCRLHQVLRVPGQCQYDIILGSDGHCVVLPKPDRRIDQRRPALGDRVVVKIEEGLLPEHLRFVGARLLGVEPQDHHDDAPTILHA